MAEDNREKRRWLPKPNLNHKIIIKHLRKAESATIRHAHQFIVKRWSNVREVQNKVVWWLVIMSLLIIATGLQLMWYKQSYLTTTDGIDGTYAGAVLGPINTLNPLLASTSAEQSASKLMFSSLMKYDKTGHINNDLVTNIKIDSTHTIYTVSIRPDVKWHDGISLTTKDIAFTIGLIKDTNTRSTISGWSNILVKVINDATIEFTLPSVYAAFEHILTFPIIPEHILGNVEPSKIRENSFSQNPIGSGPFKLRFVQNVNSNSDRKIIYMARNDQYYGGTAKLARIQLNAYDSTTEIIKALNLNEVNASSDLSPIDIKQIDFKKYSVSVKPIQSGVYAIINTKSPILSDVALRRALRLATNTEAIRDKLPEGTPSLDLPFTNNQLTGLVPKAPDFNLVEAKKALDNAGWLLSSSNTRVKDGKVLKISVVTMKSNEFEGVLETLAGQWRAVGITVDTQIADPTDLTQNVAQNILQPRNFDVLLYRLDIGADPDVYAYWDSTQATPQGLNFSNYSNSVISDYALESARTRVEPELRNAKYITFAEQWLSDVPAIGLYQSTVQYVYGDSVHTIDSSSVLISAVDRYSDVLNWSTGSRTVYKTP